MFQMIMTMRAKYVSQMRQMNNEKWEMAKHAHVDCNIVFYSLQIRGRDYYSQLRFEWFSITIIHIFLWTNFLFERWTFFSIAIAIALNQYEVHWLAEQKIFKLEFMIIVGGAKNVWSIGSTKMH